MALTCDSPVQAPCPNAALAMYRWRSPIYDLQLAPYDFIRQLAVKQLGLLPGHTVVDIGCGTGMSLSLLTAAVGPSGRVVAVDQCPQMIEMARQRVDRHGWNNVELLCSPIHDAVLPLADTVLMHLTHDILQTPDALDHVFSRVKPGTRVACTGLKWASPANFGLNALVYYHALQSMTTLGGLDCPWQPLLDRGLALDIQTTMMDTVFIASGTVASR